MFTHLLFTSGHTVFELMFMPCLFAGCWVVFDCFSLLGFLSSKFLTFFALKLSDLLYPWKRTWTLKKRLVSNQNLIFPSIVCQLPAVPFVLRGIGQFEVVSFDRSREDESKSGGARDQIYRRLGRIFQWISNHSIVVVGCEKHHLANSHLYCLLLRVQYL